MIRKFGFLVLLVLVASAVQAGEPVSIVTAIDARSGVVTAKEMATGRTFQFKLLHIKSLGSLRVGHALVEADLTSGKVAVYPARGGPINSVVTAVDAPSRTVSVKEIATGSTAQLKVNDSRLFGSLKVGQGVNANVTTGSITVPVLAAAPIPGMIVK